MDNARRCRRYHGNLQFRLAVNLRNRVYAAMTRGYRAGSAVRDLGCTIPELIAHLEAQFTEGMSWENFGAWHLDHKTRLSWFDLTNREQFLRAAHYTNLQPLWAADNISKLNRWEDQ